LWSSKNFTAGLTPFPLAIRHVVVVRTDKEMRGVDATPNITMMEHLHTLWDSAESVDPRCTMGENHMRPASNISVAI
jgi:hypothetical protein